MMINRRRVCGGEKLPYDAEIEYLESSGTQYIDTGIKGNTLFKYIISYRLTERMGAPLFGMRNQATYSQGPVFSYTYGRQNDLVLYVNNSSHTNRDDNYFYGKNDLNEHELVIDFKNNILTIDGNSAPVLRVPQAFETTYNMYLFSNNVAGTTSPPIKSRMYSYKVFNDNLLVQVLIPVRVGNVGYMYDKVSGQLFGNAGTGSFILGPDK